MSKRAPRGRTAGTLPLAPTVSACTPPRRHAVASRLDKAHAYALLFGEPVGPVKVGRFTLLELVGSGGMGEIYAAYDDQLDRKVALKLVRSDHSTWHSADERLLREAQTLAQLSHPNVVQVYEAGYFEGRVFIAMEFVRGRSLRVWLQEHVKAGDRASQREVLRQFGAAARGLQAAHAAGLVHRDFKPENVLIGDDGWLRVVDFGLARAVTAVGRVPAPARASGEPPAEPMDEPFPHAVERPRQAARVLTSLGQIVGTPQYMSPEQIRGEIADHRSDQFSFCVALYEALYGQRPFSGVSLDDRLRAIESVALGEPPRGSDVPAPVRKALLRGLSADPADRFPDMGALLDALREWPRRRRRRWLIAGILTMTLAGGVAIWKLALPRTVPPCADSGQPVAEQWTPARRAEIRAAFARTGLAYAEASWNAAEKHIDAYAHRLQSEMMRTCKASHRYGAQVREFWDQRMSCLDSGEQRLKALLDALERADATHVTHAYEAALELPDLNECRNARQPSGDIEPPPPDKAAMVKSIRGQLARAHTQLRLGQSEEALRIALRLLEQSRALDYGPVHAEALFQTGRILIQEGTVSAVAEGERKLQEAGNLALRHHHDTLVVESWSLLLLSAVRHHTDTVAAHEWQERASAFIERIDAPPRYQADLHRNLGRLAYREAHFEEAEKHQREALELLEKNEDAPPLRRALYLHDLASTLRDLSRYREAQEAFEQALALYAELGATHPYILDLRIDIAMLHATRGDLDTARGMLDEILRIGAGTTGDQHPMSMIGRAHLEIAEIHRQRGALDLGMTHVTAGIGIYEAAYGQAHDKLADAYARLGPIAYRRGLYEEALAAYEKSLALMVRYRGQEHLDTGLSRLNIAEAQVMLGRHDAALAMAAQAERVLAPYLDQYFGIAPFLASVRGRALLGRGEARAAAQALERATQGFDALPAGSMAMERADASWALVQALTALGRGGEPATRTLAEEALSVYQAQEAEAHTPEHAVQRWLRDAARHR